MSLRLSALVGITAALCFGQDLQKGIDQVRSGKVEDAASTLQAVVDQEPTNGRARFYLAMALFEQNKNAAAQTALSGPEGTSDEDYLQLGRAWGQVIAKDYSGAEESISKGASINSDNPELPYVRGVLKVAKKDYQGGAADLDRALEISPSNANAHYYDGMAYNGLKRSDKMVEHFQTFLKLAPDSAQAAKVRSLLRAVH